MQRRARRQPRAIEKSDGALRREQNDFAARREFLAKRRPRCARRRSRAVEEMKVAKKETDFGVTTKMNAYESVKAFGANLSQRKAKLLAGGKTEEEAKIEIARSLKEAGVAGDIRERRGLVAGFGRMGTRLAGDGKLIDNQGTSSGSRIVELYNGRAIIRVKLNDGKSVAPRLIGW